MINVLRIFLPDLFPNNKRTKILLAALRFLVALIVINGMPPVAAFAMASKKYHVSEDVLKKAAKEQPWAQW